MMTTLTLSALRRPAPAERIPDRPPEMAGRARDRVRLVVTTHDADQTATFVDLPAFLDPGDLLVVNDSATLAASLPVGDGEERLHLSGPTSEGDWIVEVRRATRLGSHPSVADHGGRVLTLPDGARARLTDAYGGLQPDGGARLWRARLELPTDLFGYLARRGRPIRYGDPQVEVPLSAYQTLFARRPGSSEMPSAARPFTRSTLRALRRRRIRVAAVTLHTGVSSQEAGEPPYPERYTVPPATAALVNATRRRSGRVVAVGTTVTRALETVAAADGAVTAGQGWTDHVVRPDAPVRAIDGLITGWHDAGATHLDLLAEVIGTPALERAYDLAHRAGIRWHEFGDSHLLLRR